VLINFWATWCSPCRAEMPAIQRRYDALKDQGFTVLAVDDNEAAQDVTAFAQAYELTFPILLDPGETVVGLYRVYAFPTTFIVDQQGVIQKLHIGALTEAALDQYLSDLGLTP
jgi:peroxiredoxin